MRMLSWKTTYNFKEDDIFACSSIIFEFNRITTRASLNALLSIDQKLSNYLSDFEIVPHDQFEDEENFLVNGFQEEDLVWYDPRLNLTKNNKLQSETS